MPHMLVRHQVTDFEAWKTAYEAHRPARDAAGLRELHVWRNVENSSDVVLLFEAPDMNKAKKLLMSSDFESRLKREGIRGRPDIVFLEGA